MTDQKCQKAWAVQVKATGKPGKGWLVGDHAKHLKSDALIYVFVDLPQADERPGYPVVPSKHVAEKARGTKAGNTMPQFYKIDRLSEGEGWEAFQV